MMLPGFLAELCNRDGFFLFSFPAALNINGNSVQKHRQILTLDQNSNRNTTDPPHPTGHARNPDALPTAYRGTPVNTYRRAWLTGEAMPCGRGKGLVPVEMVLGPMKFRAGDLGLENWSMEFVHNHMCRILKEVLTLLTATVGNYGLCDFVHLELWGLGL